MAALRGGGKGKCPPKFFFCPPNCPPRWFQFAQTAYGFTQFQNMACLLTVIMSGFTLVLLWNCIKCIISGLLNHSLPRCSKICSQDESARGTVKTILPPQKTFLCPPPAPPPHLFHPGAATGVGETSRLTIWSYNVIVDYKKKWIALHYHWFSLLLGKDNVSIFVCKFTFVVRQNFCSKTGQYNTGW